MSVASLTSTAQERLEDTGPTGDLFDTHLFEGSGSGLTPSGLTWPSAVCCPC